MVRAVVRYGGAAGYVRETAGGVRKRLRTADERTVPSSGFQVPVPGERRPRTRNSELGTRNPEPAPVRSHLSVLGQFDKHSSRPTGMEERNAFSFCTNARRLV